MLAGAVRTFPTILCRVCSARVAASAYSVPAELAMMLKVWTPAQQQCQL
jgi:hypothetical protein